MAQDDVSSGPAHPLIESDHIEGTAVYDVNGKRIGTITRFVIEKVSGHVAYAVTSFGGFLGMGARSSPSLGSSCTTTRVWADTEPASQRISSGRRPSSRGRTRHFCQAMNGMNSASTISSGPGVIRSPAD